MMTSETRNCNIRYRWNLTRIFSTRIAWLTSARKMTRNQNITAGKLTGKLQTRITERVAEKRLPSESKERKHRENNKLWIYRAVVRDFFIGLCWDSAGQS